MKKSNGLAVLKKGIFRNPTKNIKRPEPTVSIDYPVEKGKILPGHFAIRCTATHGEYVEISINGGQWQVCRMAGGYHWLDWWPQEAGAVKISARIRSGDDKWVKSKVRKCTVSKS